MPKNLDVTSAQTRLPHAVLDEPSRILKTKKIIALLGELRFAKARRVLEIGCGSGVISSTLAKMGDPGLKVTGIDVTDSRIVTEGYEFINVDGTSLPFESDSFDIVISNHVIEHVGGHSDQMHHVHEILRVMKSSGITYLAVPNKWRLIEPHYRLPLLSWIPIPLADLYLRSTNRGSHYDCVPLSRSQARSIFRDAGFRFQEMTIEAVRLTLSIEFPQSPMARMLAKSLPSSVIALAKPFISTLIFRLEKPVP
jgi:2-polyprenyl-3-methyl-5-hydroxy-6-metoxy-1,4-benzoquinol methylase